ncbi:MAG: trypsin-like peptidase domain-containing protein [Ruminiclostridium sp.]|nr:trypsin-like peptidase domain-containing protein [Ruminiclostridium sp.]
MEQNYNNNGYNNYNGYQQPQDQQQYVYAQPAQTVQPEKKKGRGKFAKALALIAAVAVVGGGAGFGGAMLASNMIKTDGDNGNARITASYNINDDKDSGEESESNGNVSSALAAISDSESGTAGSTSGKRYPTSVTPTGANGAYTADELYEAVNDTIVLVKVYQQNSASSFSYYDYYFGYGVPDDSSKNDEPVYTGYGSGIVFTEDGYIITNAHVVDGATKLVVEVNDYNDPDKTHEYEAELIGSDTSTDVAVLKISRDEPFLAAKIGDSDSLKVGQDVCVIGNPGITAKIMFDHTMTKGIVSGLDVECLADNGYSISLIQTDAAINSGNSGGGMFDMYGNVVGIVNSKIIASTYEGIGFALTINEAKPIMEDLLNYGYVKSRPVLGVTTVELTEYRAQLYGAKLSKGLLISGMNEGAPVEKSGLKVADIITKINGINVETVSDVQSIIGKLKVGDTVTATVARENGLGGMDSIDIEIELTESSNGNVSSKR